MKRHRIVLSNLAMLSLVAGLWWLFGWKKVDDPAAGRVSYLRVFGRVMVLSTDADRDGVWDSQAFFRWRAPYEGPNSRWRWRREDRNDDGRWDTWLENLGDTTDFLVDLDGDEEPDWMLTAADPRDAYRQIRERRGY